MSKVDPTYQHLFNQQGYLTDDALKLYAFGKLTEAEMAVVAAALESDPFAQDALEGIKTSGSVETVETAVQEINTAIDARIEKKEERKIIPLMMRYSAAASIILVVGVAFYLFNAQQDATFEAESVADSHTPLEQNVVTEEAMKEGLGDSLARWNGSALTNAPGFDDSIVIVGNSNNSSMGYLTAPDADGADLYFSNSETETSATIDLNSKGYLDVEGDVDVSTSVATPSAATTGFGWNGNSSTDGDDTDVADPSGKVEETISGGTQPYSYSWDNANAIADTISTLTPGAYSVTVTDTNGSNSIALNDDVEYNFGIGIAAPEAALSIEDKENEKDGGRESDGVNGLDGYALNDLDMDKTDAMSEQPAEIAMEEAEDYRFYDDGSERRSVRNLTNDPTSNGRSRVDKAKKSETLRNAQYRDANTSGLAEIETYAEDAKFGSFNGNITLSNNATMDIVTLSGKLEEATPSYNYAAAAVNPDSAYLFVNEMPEYPGGATALLNHMSGARFAALSNGQQTPGGYHVYLIVEADGAVSNVDVKKRPEDPEDLPIQWKEAIADVAAKMERWRPGRKDGNAVRVRMLIPIDF